MFWSCQHGSALIIVKLWLSSSKITCWPATVSCMGTASRVSKRKWFMQKLAVNLMGRKKAKGRKAQEPAEWFCLLECEKTREFFLRLWPFDFGEIIPPLWASVSSFVLWGHRKKLSLRWMSKKPPQKTKTKKPFHRSSVSICIYTGIAMHWCELGPLHCATWQFHHHQIFHSIFFFTMSENRLHSAF